MYVLYTLQPQVLSVVEGSRTKFASVIIAENAVTRKKVLTLITTTIPCLYLPHTGMHWLGLFLNNR